jgi:hypothetical protein
MAQTKIKAAQFSGVIGNGTSGYILQSSGNGDMEWVSNITDPTVLSVAYPGDDTAADPTGGQTVTITGTGFQTGANVTIGGTAATSVSFVSATTLTITTPAKAAGDYDIVVTNTDTGTGTKINGISYNGVPAWTTAAGSLGTFASGETISTITLQASEPDAGTITFDIISGTLPTGLSLTGANINGTTSLETADTLYNFTIEAIDDENQATPRAFSITVTKQFLSTDNFTINTYTGNGSTQSIEGKIGTAAAGFAYNKYITFPDLGGFTSNTSDADGSLSIWINFNSIPASSSDFYTLLDRGNPNNYSSAYQALELLVFGTSNTNEVELRFRRGFSGTTYDPPSYSSARATVATGTWYNLVISYVASTKTATFYLSGSTPIGSYALTSATGGRTIDSGFNIGTYGNSSSYSAYAWNGKVDQFRIFNKAISSSEVTTLYGENNTSTTKSKTDIFNDGSGIALYEFEKGGKDTGGVTGYIGSGGVFDGTNSKITTSYNALFNDFSISLWVKINDISSYQVLLGTTDSYASLEGLGMFYDSSLNTIGFDGNINGTRINNQTGSYQITQNQWHHVVFTNNSSNNEKKLYIDNNLQVNNTSLGYINGQNYNLVFGSYNAYTNDRLNGSIDQVRIFNKTISSNEITTLYQETSASATKSTTDIFDDGSGTALYELEGNANDTGGVSGKFGLGFVSSGESGDEYIDLPDALSRNQSQTLSAWIYPVTQSIDIGTAIRLSEDDHMAISYNTSGQFEISGVRDSGNTYAVFANVTKSANQWYHIVIARNASQIKLYIDGSLVETISWSGNVYSVGGQPYGNRIGQNNLASQLYTRKFAGKVDDVRVYSDELTSTEVGYIYNNTTASIPTDNLLAHYEFEGNVLDSSSNGNNATDVNVKYNYNGTATNVSYAYDGTPTNVSFVGTSFQPDFVWFKERGPQGFSHGLYDSVRGANRILNSNLTNAETTLTQGLQSFNTNGFTVGNNNQENASGSTYVAWCWKAGGTAVSNTDGTITSTVSANPDAGFSIVKYTGVSGGGTWGHGLSSEPELIIFKRYTVAQNWYVFVKINNVWHYIEGLNTTAAAVNYSASMSSTSTTVNFPSSNDLNQDTNSSYLAYCFHSVDGYQKVGYYTSDASVKITTGFEPRWIMQKYTGVSSNWWIMDTARYDGSTGSHGGKLVKPYLEANTSNAEGSVPPGSVEFVSDGFYPTNFFNSNGVIYLAIA